MKRQLTNTTVTSWLAATLLAAGPVLGFASHVWAQCPPAPRGGCAQASAGGTRLQIKVFERSSGETDGEVRWRWRGASRVPIAMLGSPETGGDGYALCLYEAGTLAAQLQLPGGTNWRHRRTLLRYQAANSAAAPDGVQLLQLRNDPDEEPVFHTSSIDLRAGGTLVPLPALPFTTPGSVTVQLLNTTGGCWEGTYTRPAVANSASRFLATGGAASCPTPTAAHSAWGDAVEPRAVHGPIGMAPVAIDPDAAASFDDVATFCSAPTRTDAWPPLLALPPAAPLPAWCSEDRAYRQLVARCDAPRVVVVADRVTDGPADGSPSAPFTTISDAIAACGAAPCHILVGPGEYTESLTVHRCTFIEGGIRIAACGVMTRGAARPRILGGVWADGNNIVLARIDVRDSSSALGTDGDVLVSDAVLRGGSGGSSSAWSATGPRLCRTHVTGGHSGAEIGWHSSRLWLAGSAVAACDRGAHLSWGSRDLKVLDSVVYGQQEAVSTSAGSHGVDVHGSRLGSAGAAARIEIAADERGVRPATFDVHVTGNRIASGALPESNPALRIVVENNIRE